MQGDGFRAMRLYHPNRTDHHAWQIVKYAWQMYWMIKFSLKMCHCVFLPGWYYYYQAHSFSTGHESILLVHAMTALWLISVCDLFAKWCDYYFKDEIIGWSSKCSQHDCPWPLYLLQCKFNAIKAQTSTTRRLIDVQNHLSWRHHHAGNGMWPHDLTESHWVGSGANQLMTDISACLLNTTASSITCVINCSMYWFPHQEILRSNFRICDHLKWCTKIN